MRPWRDDFVKHGFTERCQGCMAIIAGRPARGHNEQCRERMMKAIAEETDGKNRVNKQTMKEHSQKRTAPEEIESGAKREQITQHELGDKRGRGTGSSSSGLKRDKDGKEIEEGPANKNVRQ